MRESNNEELLKCEKQISDQKSTIDSLKQELDKLSKSLSD